MYMFAYCIFLFRFNILIKVMLHKINGKCRADYEYAEKYHRKNSLTESHFIYLLSRRYPTLGIVTSAP